jgi:hypothetical protein
MFRGEKVLDGSFWYFVTKDRTTGLPIPSETELEDIFWVDYTDDDIFMDSVSGNIVELASPSKVLEMMEDGYNFMKREHYYGRLPIAKTSKPPFVYVSELMSSVTKIPQQLQNLVLTGKTSEEEVSKERVGQFATSADAAAASPLAVPVILPGVKAEDLALAQRRAKEDPILSTSKALKTRPKKERVVSPSNRWIPRALAALLPASAVASESTPSAVVASESAAMKPTKAQAQDAVVDSDSSQIAAWSLSSLQEVEAIRSVFMTWASDIFDAKGINTESVTAPPPAAATAVAVSVPVSAIPTTEAPVLQEGVVDGWSVAFRGWLSPKTQLTASA